MLESKDRSNSSGTRSPDQDFGSLAIRVLAVHGAMNCSLVPWTYQAVRHLYQHGGR